MFSPKRSLCLCPKGPFTHFTGFSESALPPLCNAQHNEKGTSWARPPRSDSQLLLSSPLPRLVSMSHYPHCGRMQTMCFNYHSLWFCPSKYLVSGSGWESLQTSCFSGFLTVVKVVMCLLKNPTLRYRTKVFGGEDLFLSFDFGIHELHLCGRVLPVRCGVSPKAPRHSWEVVPRGEMSEHWACPGRGHWDPALPFSSPLCFPADCQGTICSIRCSCQEGLPQNISRGKAAKRPRTDSSEAITGSITFSL